ncbi:DUF423 domain-containing protein [Paenibacillus protaetiae]|uniref:DUF423 domain-containing protein n=2 Tax=Paenibacillus protaetiae TaxID=2509456 RepID=A0A4P6EXY8_9BACL|nr:DUF423 domain-containing protein [Paenibacillus protaetiae]QAY68270.1 DUF423 domain-containing protein [Paenibacillus protaetiae]
MSSKYFAIGAIGAALGVAIGAFGAHGLDGKITQHYIDIYETGVRYHMYHCIGIMLIALLAGRIGESKLLRAGANLLIAGVVIFSGSLYALALSSVDVLGAITPIGGVAFIAGWICVAAAAWRAKGNRAS